MMKYRVTFTVDAKSLGDVLGPIVDAMLEYSLEVTDSVPKPVGDILRPGAAPKTHKKIIRARKDNGGEWPPALSLYSRVLEALEGGPKTPSELRDFLKASGFSPSSVGSALNRLEKHAKIKNLGDGTWGTVA
jgi:hypothetical protein